MLAALETVRGLRRNHRAVAVLGDMLELGGASDTAHREIGAAVARLDFDYLLACGSFAALLAAGARAAGMDPARVHAFAGKEEMIACLRRLARAGEIGAGDWLLVKGSRGAGMETVVAALKEGR
jgi:UDP-N-acetylmuramyl pentapeptide synthase